MYNADFLSREHLEKLGFGALGGDVLVHSTAVLVGCARIFLGSRVRIDPFCVLSAGTRITIGSNVHIAGHCMLAGAGTIELCDFSGISHGTKVLSSSDDFTQGFLSGPTVPDAYKNVRSAPVTVGRHAGVGANSVILPGATIGEGATVGALSLVKGRVEPWSVVAGIPVRTIGTRDSEQVLAREREYLRGV